MMYKKDTNLIDKLVERAKTGDRNAFSEIVKLMMNKIVALTYKMTGDRDNAIDLAQDSFVTAWEKLDSFKGDSRFESWLYRIAVNKSLNFIKRENKLTSLEFNNQVASDNPERDIIQNELRENIMSFMLSLPAQQRTVFELHFYKELTFYEISDITGKALGTVKTLYREAVIKLRNLAKKKGWYHEF